jgi:hypothetical protein
MRCVNAFISSCSIFISNRKKWISGFTTTLISFRTSRLNKCRSSSISLEKSPFYFVPSSALRSLTSWPTLTVKTYHWSVTVSRSFFMQRCKHWMKTTNHGNIVHTLPLPCLPTIGFSAPSRSSRPVSKATESQRMTGVYMTCATFTQSDASDITHVASHSRRCCWYYEVGRNSVDMIGIRLWKHARILLSEVSWRRRSVSTLLLNLV